ncbi:MAG: hypothetical protein ABII79_00560 [bacterium]
MRDYNWDRATGPKLLYKVTVGFDTFYQQPVPDTLMLDSIPLISIDSFCIQLYNSARTTCPAFGLGSRADRLSYYGGKWHGPHFGTENDVRIYREDEDIGVSFVVVLHDRITGTALQRQEFIFVLKRYHDRYWIFAD